MNSKADNMFKNIDFSVFNALTDALKNATEKFWELDVKAKIQAINDFREVRDEKIISKMDFFTSQIKVENHKPIFIRLNKSFIETFLNLALNDTFEAINLSQLTDLEIKILNSYCEFLYKKIQEKFLPVKDIKITEKSEKNINILFNLIAKNNENTSIMLSFPQDRLNIIPVKKKTSFSDKDFLSSFATVGIKVGTSKIALKDLQNLEKDDIVLLEESDISKSILISGEVREKFNVKINPNLILHLDDEENEEIVEQINDEVKMSKNLWDDIQVEINAEFEKVKMSIGELKQITEGQIVDLGSIFESEISLFVEDKKVAKGELLIINDRYAVKLNEVLSSKEEKISETRPVQSQIQVQAKPQPKPQAQPQAKPQPQAQAKPQPQPKPQPKPQAQSVQNEEFDYSDFEK